MSSISSVDVKTAKTGFWHLPKTFYAVLFIEFWERCAFYGLQSVAILYYIQNFHITESHATNLFSSFSALLYAMLTIGGLIGDKILGLRRTYFLGILFLIVGYAMVSIASQPHYLYFGMGIVLMGNIFFKTNATNYVSRCFESGDPRLDSAFTYFYMSINLGSLLGLVAVPVLSKAFGYELGLALCSIGMGVALIAYFAFRERFKLTDNQVGRSTKNMWKVLVFITLIGAGFSYLFGYLLQDLSLSQTVLYCIAGVSLIVYLIIMSKVNKNERKGMLIALALMTQAIIFFIMYIQSATSMTLFALHNVRLTFFHYSVPAGLTQSFNPFFIIVLSPILANIYIMVYKKGINYAIPAKFATGVILGGLAFIVLGFSASYFADSNSQVSVVWLFIAYGFYSLGELLVSALGTSMVAQLLPKRLGGFAQGMWFLATAIGMRAGGTISNLAGMDSLHNAVTNNTEILHSYMVLFYEMGSAVVVIGFIFFLSVKPITKAMQSVIENKY